MQDSCLLKLVECSNSEVKQLLDPLYDALEKHLHSGDMEKAVEAYHSDGVVVERGVSVAYGRARK